MQDETFEEHEHSTHPTTAVPETSGTVTLRHPHTGDIQEVENTPDALTPWMIKGYHQHKGE